jgi:hypothetical protein
VVYIAVVLKRRRRGNEDGALESSDGGNEVGEE